MKTYVMVTGLVFAVLVVVHLWRVLAEGSSIGTDPHFIVITIIAALLAGWSCVVYRRIPPRS